MPTGLRNVVCDECSGGRYVSLPSGEIQLEHDNNCMYKYREDTFLIDLMEGFAQKNPKDKMWKILTYPDVKLNPIIYDMFCDGWFAKARNKINGYLSQKHANNINKNFQLVKQALKDDGRWEGIRDNFMVLQRIELSNKKRGY